MQQNSGFVWLHFGRFRQLAAGHHAATQQPGVFPAEEVHTLSATSYTVCPVKMEGAVSWFMLWMFFCSLNDQALLLSHHF